MTQLIITATWMMGYMSDVHASVWCLAASLYSIFMVLEPNLFRTAGPPPAPSSSLPCTRLPGAPLPESASLMQSSSVGADWSSVASSKKAKKQTMRLLQQTLMKKHVPQDLDDFGWGWLDWFVKNEPEAAQHWQERKEAYDRFQSYANSTAASGKGQINFAKYREQITDPTFVNVRGGPPSRPLPPSWTTPRGRVFRSRKSRTTCRRRRWGASRTCRRWTNGSRNRSRRSRRAARRPATSCGSP